MEKEFMTFKIADGIYGIDILEIKEVQAVSQVTPVPLTDEVIVGLLNLRGQIVTVIDAGIPLGYPKRRLVPSSYLLIVKPQKQHQPDAQRVRMLTHEAPVALLIDRIGDVISCGESQIEAAPSHLDEGLYLDGALKWEDSLIGLIGISKLLNYNRLGG